MADPAIGQVAASVWENKIGGKPTDNIFNSRALFHALGDKGFKEQADGGRLIEMSIEYAENGSMAMIGELDTLDTTRYDVFDAARYEWKIAAGTVVYSELEKLRAAAASRKFDVIAEKLQNGKDSHIQLLNEQFWGSGSGSNDIGGIQHIISTTPTTGTVGGINGATFSFWRNRQNSGAKTTTAFDNLQSTLRTTKNQCSLGGVDALPTAIITTRTVQEGLASTMVENIRYKPLDGSADPDFKNTALSFSGTPVFYDEDAASGNAYLVNPKYLKAVYLKGGWMKMYEAVDPANQLANVHKVATFCNLASSARRHLGVVSGIT